MFQSTKNLFQVQKDVRGRNSDNTRIRSILNWAPTTTLKDGIQKTFNWIKMEIEKERSTTDITMYADSQVIAQNVHSLESVGQVRN